MCCGCRGRIGDETVLLNDLPFTLVGMTEEQPGPGIGEGPSKAISVSLPEGTLEALRAVAGKRGVSAFIAAAVEQKLRDIATDQYIAEYEAEHGEITEEELTTLADKLGQARKAREDLAIEFKEEQAEWRQAS
jgi:hypothetical protein